MRITHDVASEKPEQDFNVYDYFCNAAIKYSNKEALSDENQSLSYHDLHLRCEAIGKNLRNIMGINKKIVGVFFERTIDHFVASLAILSSGNAFLPIDPDYPLERIKYIFEDSKINFIVTTAKLSHKLRECVGENISIICIDDEKKN